VDDVSDMKTYDSDYLAIDQQIEEDKTHLLAAAQVLCQVMKESITKKEVNTAFPDGRQIRIVFTDLRRNFKLGTKRDSNIVGFFGNRQRLHEANFEAVSKCWKADELLVSSFDPMVRSWKPTLPVRRSPEETGTIWSY